MSIDPRIWIPPEKNVIIQPTLEQTREAGKRLIGRYFKRRTRSANGKCATIQERVVKAMAIGRGWGKIDVIRNSLPLRMGYFHVDPTTFAVAITNGRFKLTSTSKPWDFPWTRYLSRELALVFCCEQKATHFPVDVMKIILEFYYKN